MPSEAAVNIWCDEMIEGKTCTLEAGQQPCWEPWWDIRDFAAHGRYPHKAGSRFQSSEANLPLDLWDSTPDP